MDRASKSNSPLLTNTRLQNRIIEKYKNIFNKRLKEK